MIMALDGEIALIGGMDSDWSSDSGSLFCSITIDSFPHCHTIEDDVFEYM